MKYLTLVEHFYKKTAISVTSPGNDYMYAIFKMNEIGDLENICK